MPESTLSGETEKLQNNESTFGLLCSLFTWWKSDFDFFYQTSNFPLFILDWIWIFFNIFDNFYQFSTVLRLFSTTLDDSQLFSTLVDISPCVRMRFQTFENTYRRNLFQSHSWGPATWFWPKTNYLTCKFFQKSDDVIMTSRIFIFEDNKFQNEHFHYIRIDLRLKKMV